MKRMLLFCLACLSLGVMAQKENRFIREGNRSFDKGNYSEAEKDYRKALEVNRESTSGQFNLGTALYQEKNFKESAGIFQGISQQNLSKPLKAGSYHNLGNSFLEAGEFEKSIEAYKQALTNNPADMDSKYNLEYARMMLQQQQQQQQQQDKNKQDQDKQDQDKQDQQDQEQDQQKQDQQQKQPPRQDKISREDAERMLEAMKNDEKKTMEKVKKQQAKAIMAGIEKDW